MHQQKNRIDPNGGDESEFGGIDANKALMHCRMNKARAALHWGSGAIISGFDPAPRFSISQQLPQTPDRAGSLQVEAP